MPIEFVCPYCNSSFQFPDEAAGRQAFCPGCKKVITTPMSGGPGVFATPAAKSKTPVILLAVVLPLVVLGLLCCGGIMMGLLLPAVQSARETAHRVACTNNLHQIALAMMAYESTHGTLPPAYIADKNGRPMHSWRVLLLPYLDANDLYKHYDFNEPWDGPHNRLLADTMPRVFRCPSSPGGQNITSYAVVVGERTAFPPGKAMAMRDIPDGMSSTLLVVEAEGANIPWMEPRDLSEKGMAFKINGEGGTEIRGLHPQGANAATCDGAIHLLRRDLDAHTLRSLIERDDGRALGPDALQ